jgi:hypothetical protein
MLEDCAQRQEFQSREIQKRERNKVENFIEDYTEKPTMPYIIAFVSFPSLVLKTFMSLTYPIFRSILNGFYSREKMGVEKPLF